ncbi:Hypothetical predicted protein [Mytilus galloprovincialis]|uniref:Uncharacterized protein n=1 Tax=Mytilus galloprovincialis TaxID=29158 RepID=A0A8B6GHW8_MYTGA|nr:Hypothetical predicted protein [Mytilus galloprovincialis]
MILPPPKVFLHLHPRRYLLRPVHSLPEPHLLFVLIFNDGSNTYLHPGNGSYSSIDITEYLNIFLILPNRRVPRWKLDKADWSLFENLCRAELQSKMFETVQDPILTFNTVLTSIADRTIPKTSANPKHPSKPWFDDACDQAIGDRKKSERRFNQQPTTEKLE